MSIKMIRVDDRLIHGQVVMRWTRTIGANIILVPNDKVAKDPLQQSLMRMAAQPVFKSNCCQWRMLLKN